MGLHLSAEDIAALETRTEGWIAGLQLAALSMQGHKDVAGFIQAFTGDHRTLWIIWLKKCCSVNLKKFETSCCRHPSLTA